MHPGKEILDLLIIGAGPYGLSLASLAKHERFYFKNFGIVGEFFKKSVPDGVLFRSFINNHLDPLNDCTIERFVSELGISNESVSPIPNSFYIKYLEWFTEKKSLQIDNARIISLSSITSSSTARFEAIDEHGRKFYSRSVVVAVGIKYFSYTPENLLNLLPKGNTAHSSDTVNPVRYRDKDVLIIGGRQSAFELAALLKESGARDVHICYRHETPNFKNSSASDWSKWFRVIEDLVVNPSWYRDLSVADRGAIDQEFFYLGRGNIEGWLKERISDAKLYPNSNVVACETNSSKNFVVKLSNSREIILDEFILATGYKGKLDRIPFLGKGNLLENLVVDNGYPKLDHHFQSNIKGLFFTGLLAAPSFGPFFALTMAARSSAKLILSAVEKRAS